MNDGVTGLPTSPERGAPPALIRFPTMKLRKRVAAVVVAVAGCWLVAGCGYSLGFRAPPGVTSIAIPIFSNNTFPLRREVEYELTNAVRKEIQARSDLELVDSEDADLVVYGTIQDFQERVFAEGRRDEKLESRLLIVVMLVVEDYRNRKQWRESVRTREPISVQIGETLADGRRRGIENLAEKVVNTLEDWEPSPVVTEVPP